MNPKITTGIAIVAVVSLLVSFFALSKAASAAPGGLFGSAGGLLAENYLPFVLYNGGYNSAKDIKTSGLLTSTGTFSVGSSGTALANIIVGNCALLGMNQSQAASSTLPYDCAVTGITSSDNVIAQFATSTIQGANAQLSWAITSAKASTTAGWLTVLVRNQSGAAATPSVTGVGSSTAYIIAH